MPRGGHSRSGPPPDPNSFRSGAGAGSTAGWIHLTTPTEPAPEWPLGTPTEAEAALWTELWTRPPASAWPQFHLTTDVAQYVRTSLAFQAGGYANAALGSLVMRMADQLGLTVGGAQRNRWLYPAPPRPEGATVTAIRGGNDTPSAPRTSKDRFRRVPPVTSRETPA